MWNIASSGVRAHRGAFAGTALVLALASAVVAVTGVLVESGIRTQAAGDSAAGGLLIALASSYAGTMLVVVVLVVAATVSLVLRGRRREFALLRTVGATPDQVRRIVVLEVLSVVAVAAPVGAVLGLLGARRLDPLLVRAGMVGPEFASTLSPLPVLAAILLIGAVALPVGLLAARESARIAPTAALQLSAVEARRLGAGRSIAAALLAAAGLVAAFSPLLVPGTTGAASAAVSAFLLIGAGGLAGPTVVGWVFDRIARLHGRGASFRGASRGASGGGSAATMLAVGNLRGFSRRLTTVVVPLALVVATATVQTTVDRAMTTAAQEQLTATLAADLVVTAPAGFAPDDAQRLAEVPGVADAVPLAAVPAQVRSGDDPFGEALSWEDAALRVVPTSSGLFDPGTSEGSLAALDAADTVSISTDAAFQTRAGLGDVLTVRFGDDVVDLSVVAVHSRGLGAGDFLTGAATAAAHGLAAPADTVLVGLVPGGDLTAVTAAVAGALGGSVAAPGADLQGAEVQTAGVQVTDVPAYVTAAVEGGAGENALSTALLLLLLVVVAVGAATTLSLTTTSRRAEFRLLHRTGTTRRQLSAMTLIESLVVGSTALVLGSLAVVPAAVGITAGLLGARLPVLDLGTYAVAGLGVVVLAVVATGTASRRTTLAATATAAA